MLVAGVQCGDMCEEQYGDQCGEQCGDVTISLSEFLEIIQCQCSLDTAEAQEETDHIIEEIRKQVRRSERRRSEGMEVILSDKQKKVSM